MNSITGCEICGKTPYAGMADLMEIDSRIYHPDESPAFMSELHSVHRFCRDHWRPSIIIRLDRSIEPSDGKLENAIFLDGDYLSGSSDEG